MFDTLSEAIFNCLVHEAETARDNAIINLRQLEENHSRWSEDQLRHCVINLTDARATQARAMKALEALASNNISELNLKDVLPMLEARLLYEVDMRDENFVGPGEAAPNLKIPEHLK